MTTDSTTAAQRQAMDDLRHGDSVTGQAQMDGDDVVVPTETGVTRIRPDGTMADA